MSDDLYLIMSGLILTRLLPEVFRNKDWGLLHTVLEILSYR